MQTTTLEVRGLFEELDHLGVEKHLLESPGATAARANPASESVTVDFDEKAAKCPSGRDDHKASRAMVPARGGVPPTALPASLGKIVRIPPGR